MTWGTPIIPCVCYRDGKGFIDETKRLREKYLWEQWAKWISVVWNMGNSDGLKRKGVDLSQGRPKRKRDVVHPRAEIETPVSTVNFMDISLSNSRTSIRPIRSLNQQRIWFILLKAMSININIEIFFKKILILSMVTINVFFFKFLRWVGWWSSFTIGI